MRPRLLCCLVLAWYVGPGAYAQTAHEGQGNIVVGGNLVCQDADGREVSCTGQDQRLGLKDSAGRVYPLKFDKSVQTLQTEPRLHSKDFQLTLRQEKSSGLFEIINSRFFRNGQLYDFYYFCDVCNIKTYHPGPCMCCQQETEYRETPVEAEK